jgi:hypothetical protein
MPFGGPLSDWAKGGNDHSVAASKLSMTIRRRNQVSARGGLERRKRFVAGKGQGFISTLGR